MNDKQTLSNTTTPRRGRPRQTPAQADAVRARIVAATAEVFTAHGSRGTSVTRIIEKADLARPTFYRYFANASEPLHLILTDSNADLITRIGYGMAETNDGPQLAMRLVDGYLAWARERGAMLRPLFAELHDPDSLVSEYRAQVLDIVREQIRTKFAEMGRAAPSDMDMDAALHLCEYLVYRLSVDTPPEVDTEQLVEAARKTMTRLSLAILGTAEDLLAARELPGLFPPEPSLPRA